MAFNKYAAGAKHYGAGRDAPNVGKSDKLGYKERTANNAAKKRRAMILKRLEMMRAGAAKK